jgi:hypothetical protein
MSASNYSQPSGPFAIVPADQNMSLTPNTDPLSNVLAGGAVGYVPGGGDAVTQQTSKSTAVATTKLRGQITTNNENLAAGAAGVSFAVNNPNIQSGDAVIVMHASGGTIGVYDVDACGAVPGIGFTIRIRNESGGALAESLVLTYAVVRA